MNIADRLRQGAGHVPADIADAEQTMDIAAAEIARLTAEVAELRDMLRVAVEAIESLDEGALGFARTDDRLWPLRDELAASIRATIAGERMARVDEQSMQEKQDD